MSKIPGRTVLDRAEYTIQTINKHLPSLGDIRPPMGKTWQVRFVLRHDALLSRVRPRQHPRVAAVFEAVPRTRLWQKKSFHGHSVNVGDIQILVPILGREIGLTDVDRNDDWVTYVTTQEEVEALAVAIAAAIRNEKLN